MKKTLYFLLILGLSFLLFSCTTKEITVSFYIEENEEPTIQVVAKGEILKDILTPEKEGYIFLGWYVNLNNIVGFNFNTKITENLKLYAKWEEVFDMDINGTKTFSANALWGHRNTQATSNLVLEGNDLMVVDASKSAFYESKPITVNSFVELVLSWNVRNLENATLRFRVAVGRENNFSKDFTMGIWEKNSPTSASNDADSFASLSHDTLTNNNLTNDLVILKVSIDPKGDSNLKLNNISVTARKNYLALTVDENVLINKELNVPKINQLSIPSIGNVICSPTSTTMVLNYYGNNFDAATVASYVKDQRSGIYGNWTFNASFAGSDKLYSRVEYIDNFNTAINYIKNDIPVVLSVTTQTKDDLPGSLSGYPSGHLIVLIGFKQVNGVWYGILNDPAFYTDSEVRKLYPLDKLLLAFKGYSYIITENPQN